VVSLPVFRGSGLTRAALRGGQFVPAFTAADTATAVAETARDRPGLVYCYSSDLDLIGHVRGTRSDAWSAQLELIDRGVQMLEDRLPRGTRLLVTGDHGMVDVPEAAKIDYDGEPVLREGIEILAGEPRARYLHVVPGELDAVWSRWTQLLGTSIELVTRDDAITRGWYGPVVNERARDRIGELIAIAVSDTAIVRRKTESRSSTLIGHHGAVTDAEMLVPLLSN
jgi:predicted AlkP superfamily pyrophosphatase or phosphodiesterase